MATFIDLTGKRFGLLMVIGIDTNYLPPKTGNKQHKWLCDCDCGKTKSIRGGCLNSGNTISCGCVVRKNGNDFFWESTYRICKTNAKNRNYEFELTMCEFKKISVQNCFYCNAAPSAKTNFKNRYVKTCIQNQVKIDESFANSKVVNVNGLDRVDNNRGYMLDNIVACCKHCNIAKRDNTKEEFEAWALRLADYIRSRQ